MNADNLAHDIADVASAGQRWAVRRTFKGRSVSFNRVGRKNGASRVRAG